MHSWNKVKNILCIRPDNMGDVIMTGPALRALKNSFGCKITLLTSTMGALITPYIGEIDETIIADLPWVKTNKNIDAAECTGLIKTLAEKKFDAAMIFTVYSQNPLPSAMLAYLANIPLRLAYCRENPYQLLTHWIPDKEPYNLIQHQVERDLALAAFTGAEIHDKHLSIQYSETAWQTAKKKLKEAGVQSIEKSILIHPGVSDKKREFPVKRWKETLQLLKQQTGRQLIITGSANDSKLAENILVEGAVNAAGLLSIEEFIAVISRVALVVSVNTATVHIASATQTPVVVLYALTNPQHTPWKVASTVLYFPIMEAEQSRNEVIQFVNKTHYHTPVDYPSAEEIVIAAKSLLRKERNVQVSDTTTVDKSFAAG